MWKGGCERGEHYYSPPGVSPLLRGHRHKAMNRTGWMRQGPSSPGREKWSVIPTLGHFWKHPVPWMPGQRHWLHPLCTRPFCKTKASHPGSRHWAWVLSIQPLSPWKVTSWRQMCSFPLYLQGLQGSRCHTACGLPHPAMPSLPQSGGLGNQPSYKPSGPGRAHCGHITQAEATHAKKQLQSVGCFSTSL